MILDLSNFPVYFIFVTPCLFSIVFSREEKMPGAETDTGASNWQEYQWLDELLEVECGPD